MELLKTSSNDFITIHFANEKFCKYSLISSISILSYIYYLFTKGAIKEQNEIEFLLMINLLFILICLITWDIYYFIFRKIFPIDYTDQIQESFFTISERIYNNPLCYIALIYLTQDHITKNNIDFSFCTFFNMQFFIILFHFRKLSEYFKEKITSITVITDSYINNLTARKLLNKFKLGTALLFISNLIGCIFLLTLIKDFSFIIKFLFINNGIYNLIKIIELYIMLNKEFYFIRKNINDKEKDILNNLIWKFYAKMVTCIIVLINLIILYLHADKRYSIPKFGISLLIFIQLVCMAVSFKNYNNTKKYYLNIESGFPLVNCKNEDCTICTEKLENARQLQCKHYFHLICLTQWIEAKNYKCPICRTDIKIDLGLLKIFQNFEDNNFYQIIRGFIPNIV
jgi:hypothetical protein